MLTADWLTEHPAPDVPLEEVEWRVDGKATNGRARYVPYLDSRTVARLLDDWVGPGNWRSAFEMVTVKGQEAVWGHIELHVDGEWVRKTDIGVTSNFEPAKGGVSDAMKRAGVIQWGVGRNVYDLPTLWGPVKEVNGKVYPADNVERILLDELRKQGHQAEATRTRTEDAVSADEDRTVADEEIISAEQATELVARFDHIEDEETRKRTKIEFVRAFGKPAELPRRRLVDAVRWVTKALEDLGVDEKPLENEEARTNEEAEKPTIAAIFAMTAREILPWLDTFGLDSTGNIGAKRTRLAEHLYPEDAAQPAAEPEPPTREEWINGIRIVEDSMNSAEMTEWIQWLSDEMGSDDFNGFSDEKLAAAHAKSQQIIEHRGEA